MRKVKIIIMTIWTVWPSSAAIAVLVFILLGSSVCGFHVRKSIAVLPHDTHPGFSIKKFNNSESINFRLLETKYSQFFTVLDNGIVMTTSDISPLVNRAVNLVVLEEMPNKTSSHPLNVYVLDRNDMLYFEKDFYEGELLENSPPSTVVSRLPIIQAYRDGVGGINIRYAIVGGNEDDAFRLKPKVYNNSCFGVELVANIPLDREKTSERLVTIQAADEKYIDKAYTKIKVNILDENDNSPVFKQLVYDFALNKNINFGTFNNGNGRKLKVVGKVSATDDDGDKIAFRLLNLNNAVVMVPQTGELILTGDLLVNPLDFKDLELNVEAHDVRTPSRISEIPARVWLRYNDSSNAKDVDGDHTSEEISHDKMKKIKHREKRRVTRAVRPTKRIEFTEADGETEGRIVFQLEKETERETFKIRDENAWVTVEPNGSVRVKKKWDYEELGPEKTIDFWVTITNNGNGGEYFIFIFTYLINVNRNFSRYAPYYKILFPN